MDPKTLLLQGQPLSPEASRAWAFALRLHGDVANDNGHLNRRRDDPQGNKGTVLHLSISPPKAG